MFAQFETYFPELAKLVVFRNLSTPLSTTAITGHHRARSTESSTRQNVCMSGALQAKTPVPGLFLAGQDVVSPGIPGALWGGLLAAAASIRRCFVNSQVRRRLNIRSYCPTLAAVDLQSTNPNARSVPRAKGGPAWALWSGWRCLDGRQFGGST